MPIERLPARLRPPARRVRGWLLTDAPAMIIIGLAVLIRGISYLDILGDPPSAGTHPAEMALPLDVWALIWIVTGAALVAVSVQHESVLAAILLGMGVALHALWGISFLIDTFMSAPRGYVTAVGYLSTVALVLWAIWRGRTGQVRRGG